MQTTLPRFKDNFDLPAYRIPFDDCCSLPYGLRYIRDKEMPCSQSQVSLGGSIAFLLRVLAGFSPPFIDTCLWNTGGDEPSLSLIFCSNDDIFLNDIALDSLQETGKLNWRQTPSYCFIDVRLMIEAT